MTTDETSYVKWIVLHAIFVSLIPVFQMQQVHSFKPSFKCPDGYTGKKCNFQCPYPEYGYRCRKQCSCNPHFCHHKNGCPSPADKCPAGYFGRNCEFDCLYPHYGLGCQRTCACPRKRCNSSNGCQYRNTVTNNQSFDENGPYLIKTPKIPIHISTRSIGLDSDSDSAFPATKLNNTRVKQNPTTGIFGLTSDKNSYKTSRLEQQFQMSIENDKIKGIANDSMGGLPFKDGPETIKGKWIEISIISAGVVAGVLLIAHVLVSFMPRNTDREKPNSRNS